MTTIKECIFDNREIKRYYDSVIDVMDEFGWEKLTASYVYFIFIKLFISRFSIKAEIIFNDNQGRRDYIKSYLKYDFKKNQNYSFQHDGRYYDNQYLNNFNEFMYWMEKGIRTNANYYKEKLSCTEVQQINEIITMYGGN